MEQTARHDVRRLVAVLIAPAAIPAWRSYRAVCAAVAVGVCWRSSMPDAIRATSRNPPTCWACTVVPNGVVGTLPI